MCDTLYERSSNSFVSFMFRAFRAKTTGSHVALHECNSGTESVRELFKPSKASVSLLVCKGPGPDDFAQKGLNLP